MKNILRGRGTLRIGLTVLLAAWLLPLLVTVNFWRDQVRIALSEVFQRPVSVGDIHLQLVGGPGFSVSNVAVGEDLAFGIEPFARAESLDARVSLASLVRGRLEFSSIDFESLSLNIVRSESGKWNLGMLGLGSTTEDKHAPAKEGPELSDRTAAGPRVFPRIRVRAGRINLKSGNLKKTYRIEALDLELTPPDSPRQPWRFHAVGMPTRTDLPFRPMNTIEASGEFGPIGVGISREVGVPLHLDWVVRDAMLAELLTVVTGQELGVHGEFSVRGHASGTTSLFRISAEGELHDLHRWDLHPPTRSSSLRADLKAVADLSGEAVELTSLVIPLGSGAITLTGRIGNIFDGPDAKIDAALNKVSLSELAGLVPQFTARLSRGLKAEGELDGRIWSDSIAGPLSADLLVSSGFMQLDESPTPVRFASFPVRMRAGAGRLGPARIDIGPGAPLETSVQWDFAKRTSLWKLRGKGVSLPALSQTAAENGWELSLVSPTGGDVALSLDVSTSPSLAPRVSGWAEISDVVMELQGLDQPARIARARLQISRDRWDLPSFSAKLGSQAFDGRASLQFPGNATGNPGMGIDSPVLEFSLHSEEADIAELASMLELPSQTGLLFGFGRSKVRPVGEIDSTLIAFWNSALVQGTLEVDSANYRGKSFRHFTSALSFHDFRLEIPEFSFEFAGGRAHGTALGEFSEESFAFGVDADISSMNVAAMMEDSAMWRGAVQGRLTGELHLSSSGRGGEEMMSRLDGTGKATSPKLILNDARFFEMLGFSDNAAKHGVSIAAQFQLADEAIELLELNATPLDLEPTQAARPDRSVLVRGNVGFDQRLHLWITPAPATETAQWEGTLAVPEFVRRIARPDARETESSTAALVSGMDTSLPGR